MGNNGAMFCARKFHDVLSTLCAKASPRVAAGFVSSVVLAVVMVLVVLPSQPAAA